MSRSTRLRAQAAVYHAVAELLRASQNDSKGWMVQDIETKRLHDEDTYTAIFAETEALIAEMDRRAKAAQRRARASTTVAARQEGNRAFGAMFKKVGA